jgi:hypothetical protein
MAQGLHGEEETAKYKQFWGNWNFETEFENILWYESVFQVGR